MKLTDFRAGDRVKWDGTVGLIASVSEEGLDFVPRYWEEEEEDSSYFIEEDGVGDVTLLERTIFQSGDRVKVVKVYGDQWHKYDGELASYEHSNSHPVLPHVVNIDVAAYDSWSVHEVVPVFETEGDQA